VNVDQLDVTTSRRRQGVSCVRVCGVLSPRTAGPIDAAVEGAIRGGSRHVQLDLRAAVIRNVDDLICLFDLHRTARRGKSTLTLTHVPRHVRELLARTYLPELIDID